MRIRLPCRVQIARRSAPDEMAAFQACFPVVVAVVRSWTLVCLTLSSLLLLVWLAEAVAESCAETAAMMRAERAEAGIHTDLYWLSAEKPEVV